MRVRPVFGEIYVSADFECARGVARQKAHARKTIITIRSDGKRTPLHTFFGPGFCGLTRPTNLTSSHSAAVPETKFRVPRCMNTLYFLCVIFERYDTFIFSRQHNFLLFFLRGFLKISIISLWRKPLFRTQYYGERKHYAFYGNTFIIRSIVWYIYMINKWSFKDEDGRIKGV